MVDYESINTLSNAITNATNENELDIAIRNYLHTIGRDWWDCELEESEKQAIRLLNFDSSVINALLFFNHNGRNFANDYIYLRQIIKELVQRIANRVYTDEGSVTLLNDTYRKDFYGSTEAAIRSEVYRIRAVNKTRKQIDEFCESLGFAPEVRNRIREIGLCKSEAVITNTKMRNNFIRELRNEYYNELFDFLAKYDKEPKGE